MHACRSTLEDPTGDLALYVAQASSSHNWLSTWFNPASVSADEQKAITSLEDLLAEIVATAP